MFQTTPASAAIMKMIHLSKCVMLLQYYIWHSCFTRERGVRKISDPFIIPGCGQQQQKEVLQSLWTQDGQKSTIYMHQVQ